MSGQWPWKMQTVVFFDRVDDPYTLLVIEIIIETADASRQEAPLQKPLLIPAEELAA